MDKLNLVDTEDIAVQEQDNVLFITLNKNLEKGDSIKVDLLPIRKGVIDEIMEMGETALKESNNQQDFMIRFFDRLRNMSDILDFLSPHPKPEEVGNEID